MKNIIEYDEESDTLLLRKTDAKIKSCLNDGTDVCILELDKDGNIVGLEFLDIHTTFGIPLKVLNNLRDSKVHIRYEKPKKTLYITIVLIYQETKERLTIPFMADLKKPTFECNNFMACVAC